MVSDIEDGGESIPVPIKLVILQQVASGMEALVDQKLIHRDLALRNVLVFALDLADAAATSVKVADFGLTVNSYTAGYNYVQGGPKPIRWLAPESLRRGKYSEKSDVWSYGVLAWELLSNGEIPCFGIPSDEGVIQHVIAGNQLARPTEQPCPDRLWEAVARCWAKLPKDRPTFARLSIELSTVMAAGAEGRVAELEDELERRTLCEVCMDRPKDHIIRPCNHLCICGDCSTILLAAPPGQRRCPMCRSPITSVERVYS